MASPCDVFNQQPQPRFRLKEEFEHEIDSNQRRVQAICQAIGIYAAAGQHVPQEWLDELRKRTNFNDPGDPLNGTFEGYRS